MTPRILLIGDSVIDNAAYVAAGEPDVATQVFELLPDATIELRAVDGSVTSEVIEQQLHDLAEDDLVVVSSGGNDALRHVGLINGEGSLPFGFALSDLWGLLQTPDLLVVRLLSHVRQIQSTFRKDYAELLDRVVGCRRRVLCLTIYDPAFVAHGMSADQQAAAEAALSLFNDVIQREALARACRVIEMRTLFDDPQDFANPIEPSMIGGAKIAGAIKRWAEEYTEFGGSA